MLVIRPVQLSDHAAILKMAQLAGIGFTSLPADPQVLSEKIENAVNSFHGRPKRAKEEVFLFVMEDTETGALVGSTGLYAHVGLSRPFYSYKLSTITQASPGIDVYSLQRVLHMVNDYTGASEIGSLFLLPEYRRDGIGRFLSRCRFLMLAEYPDLFAKTVIAEIRGHHDEKGDSPFYDNLARHFFHMEFKKADYTHATKGGQFIADLMPKYPIYVELLPPEAQAVISKPLEGSLPAMKMLEAEGFRHQGYVDVFDGGPTIEAGRRHIKSVQESRTATIREVGSVEGETNYLIANCRLPDFRMLRAPLKISGEEAILNKESLSALNAKPGDKIRYVAA